jgi:membrane protein implicated in regulation of membrane protease activity
MKIAKPMLLVSTPLGAAFGIREAYRFHWWLAALMAVLMAVIAALLWMTWAQVRRERHRSEGG